MMLGDIDLPDPAVFKLDPNYPITAFATINRYLIAFRQEILDSAVSMEDLRMVADFLTLLSDNYLAALQASVTDRADLRAKVDDLLARVAALEARRMVLAGRNVALPLLAIGSTDITVSWGKSLGDASYQVELIRDAAMPAGVTLTVKTTYATSCIVTARATLAVPLGTTFDAIAYRN